LIEGHDIATVQDAGWAGASNGDLLKLADDEFDVFVSVDSSLPTQQNLGSGIAVITLAAPTNRFQDLEPLVPSLLKALETIRKGQLVRLGG
jgi:hypothetical protein